MFDTLLPLGPTLPARVIGALFFFIADIRNRYWDTHPEASYRASSPVISVGGVNAGGTGKTPIAMMIARHFAEKGRHVALISRGYRRRSRVAVISPPGRETNWQDVGDEPAMVRHRIPSCWLGIGADRRHSIKRISALTQDKAVFILDDGFQHRRVARDADIVTLPVDAFGDLPIPAGTLREPAANIRRASIVCVTGFRDQCDAITRTCAAVTATGFTGLVAGMVQEPDVWINVNTGKTSPVPPVTCPVVICGIARPQRFLSMLNTFNLTPVKSAVYPDHFMYNDRSLEPLIDMIKSNGLVTTEKDAVRLQGLKLVNRFDMWYLRIRLTFLENSVEQRFNHCLDTLS